MRLNARFWNNLTFVYNTTMTEKKMTAYKGFNKDITCRLQPIPTNTVVHTPTEAEAKELLAMLVQNRWSVDSLDYNVASEQHNGLCYCLRSDKTLDYDFSGLYQERGYTILTLDEFKERYCEEDKPQPKFKVGDKVRVSRDSKYKPTEGVVSAIGDTPASRIKVAFQGWGSEWFNQHFLSLEPYTDPETKPTEDMETKVNHNLSQNSAEKCNNNNAISTDEKKELNLCELLEGHEGETIFLTTMGTVIFHGVSEQSIQFKPHKTAKDTYLLKASGKMSENGVVITYPTRALYKQYPLDPYTAWMKWQEEQKCHIEVIVNNHDSNGDLTDCAYVSGDIAFCTPTDRDKCIGEIKAIINKYSK